MNNVVTRLLRYIKFNTQSMENQGQIPSTHGQLLLANALVEELKELKLEDISMDGHGFVMATLPSNINVEVPTIGFISHLDTCPDYPGDNIKPQFFYNYSGEDLVINKENNTILSPIDFPEMLNYIGNDIITSDGTTLLGADDKSGIAEIMTAIEYLINHPEIKHGPVRIGFTPDEELDISGINLLNLEKFNTDFSYTVDGGSLGEINFENFNGACLNVTINGLSIHSGMAKGKMINAIIVATEFIHLLPSFERPEHTSGYEGFYFVTNISGDVEQAEITINIRDFDIDNFENRKNYIKTITEFLNKKYNSIVVEYDLVDIYFNMGTVIDKRKEIIDIPIRAMIEVGLVPQIVPIRGASDGSSLTFKGLFTPNIFTGTHNSHSKFEFIPIQSMEKAVEVIVKIIEINGTDNS